MAVQILNAGGLGGGEAIRMITVASASALPGSAKDNLLALVTTVTPGKIRLSHASPDAPAAGDVWIMTSVSGSRALQVGRKNLLTTYLVRAYQYVASVWVLKDLFVRIGGAWLNTYTYLYSRGTEFVTVHGFNGSSVSDSPANISKQPTYFIGVPAATATNWKGIYWDALELTDYSTLRLVISTPNSAETVGFGNSTSNAIATISSGLDEATVDVNIATLNGAYKLWIGRITASADAFRVYEAFLI